MDIESILAILGAACYAAASLRAGFSLFGDKPRSERPVMALLAAGGAALATVLTLRGWRAGAIPVFTRFDAMAAYALAIGAAYLALALFRHLRGVAAILVPYATLFLFGGLSGLAAPPGAPVPLQGPWLALHVATAYAAYGVFTLAGVHAAVYLVQDGNLKHKRFGRIWERLPSLEILDRRMSRLAGIAFLLLTGSLVFGFMLARANGADDQWVTDPKIAATTATWILFAVFVHLRASADRHGKRIALMALAGLACLLFAFLGVHLFAPTLHAFLDLGGAP